MNNKWIKKIFKLPPKKRIIAYLITLLAFFVFVWIFYVRIHNRSYKGKLPPLTENENLLMYSIKKDVEKLAGDFSERNLSNEPALSAAANFIFDSLSLKGFKLRRQEYKVEGIMCCNIEAEIKGGEKSDEIVIIGAHYDSKFGTPGAVDNASGAAAVIALAKMFEGEKPARTLRFVEFVNEEPPYFQTEHMGSLRYAKQCRQRGEKIVAMINLDMVGFFKGQKNNQKYPFPFSIFYPSVGNFIAFVSNIQSGSLLSETIKSFRQYSKFPAEGAILPEFIKGVDWSDHWSFWSQGYKAIMITDMGFFRYPYYHQPEDTPDKIDYKRLAQIVAGLEKTIRDFVYISQANN